MQVIDKLIINRNKNIKEKVLVLAYPGAGKSYLADNYKDVSDFEFQHYSSEFYSARPGPNLGAQISLISGF